jgi:hypothetical protein
MSDAKPPLAGATGSAFFEWFHAGRWAESGKDSVQLAQAAWDAAVLASEQECREYAHSGANVYRRQVSYACQRRIAKLRQSPNACVCDGGEQVSPEIRGLNRRSQHAMVGRFEVFSWKLLRGDPRKFNH